MIKIDEFLKQFRQTRSKYLENRILELKKQLESFEEEYKLLIVSISEEI
jgi:hypothetical protein